MKVMSLRAIHARDAKPFGHEALQSSLLIDNPPGSFPSINSFGNGTSVSQWNVFNICVN